MNAGAESNRKSDMIKTIPRILLTCIIVFSLPLNGCRKNDNERYVKNLQSDNPLLIQEAVYYLGKEKDINAVPPLIDLIKATGSETIRKDAIRALGDIKADAAVDVLIDELKNPDEQVKIVTVEALGKIREVRAVPPLIQILPDPSVCLTAIWALGNIGDKAAVDSLSSLLQDEDVFVRFNASQSLKKIGQAH